MTVMRWASEHALVASSKLCFPQSQIHIGTSSVTVIKCWLLPSYMCAVSLCVTVARRRNKLCKEQNCHLPCLQMSKYESTVERLSAELGTTRQELDQLQGEQNGLRSTNEQLHADLEASQEQVYSQIADYKSQIDQLQEQLTDAKEDLSSAQQLQQSAEAAQQQLQADLSSAQLASSQEVRNLQEQVAQLEQQSSVEAAQHDDTVQTQRAELAQKAKRVAEFEAAIRESDEARVRLEEEYGYALQEAGQREEALREELAATQVAFSAQT